MDLQALYVWLTSDQECCESVLPRQPTPSTASSSGSGPVAQMKLEASQAIRVRLVWQESWHIGPSFLDGGLRRDRDDDQIPCGC